MPLESPESLGRTERHGGLLKALFRRVCAEVVASSKEQVESCLTQVLCVKNGSARVGGFSPSQWVLGRAPRGVASIVRKKTMRISEPLRPGMIHRRFFALYNIWQGLKPKRRSFT